MNPLEKLPHPQDVWVEEQKICGYLLNLAHPQGGSKAKFFKARGFTAEAWTSMRDALIKHGTTNTVVRVLPTEFGTRYTVECTCTTPDALNPCIRSVWEVKPDDPRPRLLTAHPFDRH